MKEEGVPQIARVRNLTRVDGAKQKTLSEPTEVVVKKKEFVDAKRFGNVVVQVRRKRSSSGVRTVTFSISQCTELGSDDLADRHIRLRWWSLLSCLRGLWWIKGWLGHERKLSRAQRYSRFD